MPNESVQSTIDRKIQIARNVEEIMTKSHSWPASLDVMEERVRTFINCEWSKLERGWVKHYRQLFSGTFSILKETVKGFIGVELSIEIIEVIASYRGKDKLIIIHSNLPRPCAHLRNICEELGYDVKSYEMGSIKPPLVTYSPIITFVVQLNGKELFLSTDRFINLGDIWKLIRGLNSENDVVDVTQNKISMYETWVTKFLKSKKLEMSLLGPRDVFTRCLITKLKHSEDINYKDIIPKVDTNRVKYSTVIARPQLVIKSNGIITKVTIRYFHTKPPKATIGQLVLQTIPPPSLDEWGVGGLLHSEIRRAQHKHAFEVWKLMQRKHYKGKKRTTSLRDHVRKRRKEMKVQNSLHQQLQDKVIL